MEQYNPKKIEEKWQEIWDKEKAFVAIDDVNKPKYYVLVEFPYPSGQGLHVGHPRPYTGMDIIARKKRMDGFNVIYPMGWDAFGLPTENYAIKSKIHPRIVTENNIRTFKSQLKSLGFSFDWSREVNTTDPSYYKWTQWIFIQLFKKGLAYKTEMPINFCTECKVGLANEEVVNGVCERCGSEVSKKLKKQWMLRITDYADRLLQDLNEVDYTERIKSQQINWIGRSEGAEVQFNLLESDATITVFTTRPDTIFGATFIAISPENNLIDRLKEKILNISEVMEYRELTLRESEIDRANLLKEKTGILLKGLTAINPANGVHVPVWAADYVLNYGTGSIMGVPGHDQRDLDFANKYKLPVIEVIKHGDGSSQLQENNKKDRGDFVQSEEYNNEIIINSGFLNGLSIMQGKEKIVEWLNEKGKGIKKVNYKLRDWVFSRQRYWGEPIPVVYCEKCGWVHLPEAQLPLLLPEIENYVPTDTGESPLALITEWVNTICPSCNGPARRETDTMPQWAGSSWYFLRYIDPDNDDKIVDPEKVKHWMPVDWYNGGNEHTTLHLLYSRFWHKFLYDIGVVPTKEPYAKRTSHGMILGENNEKMSKSRGNVVNPDDIVSEFGADTLRVYEMFMGTFDQSAAWSAEGVRGCRRFLDRTWRLREILDKNSDSNSSGPGRIGIEKKVQQTIKKVTLDYEKMKYNTAIASLMELINEFYSSAAITLRELKIFLLLLSPVAPHIAEEMYQVCGFEGRLYNQQWPNFDETRMQEDLIEVPIQINGKFKKTIPVSKNADQKTIENQALEDQIIKNFLIGKRIVKIIFVPGKIFNIVVNK